MTFKELEESLTSFILDEYHNRIHGTTKQKPKDKWNETNFLPNLPETLEQLDLLLLNVSKPRKVHSDGIHFQGFKYINSNLVAYVGEQVIIRYDPKDMAEIRVFYKEEYLCTAICIDLSNYTVDVKEIIAARNKHRKDLKSLISPDKNISEEIKLKKQEDILSKEKTFNKSKLKRYFNE